MDIALYGVMIMAPIIYLVLKISISYRIHNIILRQKHSKTFIKRHKGSGFVAFFAWNFRKEIKPLVFIQNIVVGLLLVFSIPLAIIYFVLWTSSHIIQYEFIVQGTAIFLVCLWAIHIINCIDDRLNTIQKK